MLAVPPRVLTTRLTVPAPAGLVQVMLVAELTVQLADVPPKLTLPLVRFAPKMVTRVPPVLLPAAGLILLMVGGET